MQTECKNNENRGCKHKIVIFPRKVHVPLVVQSFFTVSFPCFLLHKTGTHPLLLRYISHLC